jgi:hypothetical protein
LAEEIPAVDRNTSGDPSHHWPKKAVPMISFLFRISFAQALSQITFSIGATPNSLVCLSVCLSKATP